MEQFKSSSCEDLAKLVEKASTPGLSPGVAALYKYEINKRRSSRIHELEARLRNGMTFVSCESADEAKQARAGIVQVQADLDELRCQDASAADALAPKVQEWIPQREAAIAEDEKCIAQKGCMAKRIAQRIGDELCPLTARRTEVTAEIARIKKYGRETGVVNVQDLYGLRKRRKASVQPRSVCGTVRVLGVLTAAGPEGRRRGGHRRRRAGAHHHGA
jgi:hypothetical protein